MGEEMNFGDALAHLRYRKKLARVGWHGKGMYLELQTPDENSKMTLPYIYINIPFEDDDGKTGGVNRVPWLASQTDLLAEDWSIIV